MQYDESTNHEFIDTDIKTKGHMIVKVDWDGVSDDPRRDTTEKVHQDGAYFGNSSSSDDTTHTNIGTRCDKWEHLAMDHGVEIKQLEYYMAVM